MADFSIPGINSKYNTNKIVEDLMKVERVPVTRMENQIKKVEADKAIWVKLNSRIADLSKATSTLYGFDNPFISRSVNSSNEDVATAVAKRGSDLQTHNIKVLQTAKADKLSSSSIQQSFSIPDGQYTFLIGNKKISFLFKGKTLDQFVKAINNRGQDVLQAKVINSSPTEKILLLESKLEGAKNRIVFDDAALDLAKKLNIIALNDSTTIKPDLNISKTSNIYNLEIADDEKVLNPNENLSLNINKSFPDNADYILELEVKVINITDEMKNKSQNKDLSASISGSITLEDITVFNNKSFIAKTEEKQIEEVKPTEDLSFLKINNSVDGGKLIDSSEKQIFRYNLKDFDNKISKLEFANNNSNKAYVISNLSIYDKNSAGEYKALNPISQASDAIFEYDGIKITRDKNQIDDVIPDLNLTLKKESNDYIQLGVVPDREKIKNNIIAFTYTYNKLLEESIIATSSNESVIDELSYLSDDEKKAAKENLGILQGDTTLNQLKNKVQNIVTNSYNYNSDYKLTLLSQIGIGSNLSGWTGYSADKYRGYLELDEDKLNAAIDTNIDGIRNLFGADTNKDLIIDNGLAYTMNGFLTPFTQKGGIIAQKVQGYTSDISDRNKRVDDFEKKLINREQEYKRKFGNMETMIESMNKNSSSIRSLNNNNSN